ncbi:MAG TPA: BTAD domain-containing putative transcriptional regulator [Longimicrobiales bacterium]|nr:BTAD domain-containing putative transcriptional regulator [Longimicrobiales bacterium]
MLQLKLFGGAMVEAEHGVVRGLSSRRHSLGLLALLTTAPGRTLSRGKLVGLLWPDAGEKVARNRLTSCVYQVRSELGSDVISSVGTDLRLNGDELTCDVERFEAATDAKEYLRAVELYDGPFLDGFWIRDSPEFDQWMDRERDRLRRMYHKALEALARQAVERGDLQASAAWWRALAASDPYDSVVVRRLMETLAEAGSRAEALLIARAHVRLLDEEFGTRPDAELQALIDAIQGQHGAHGPTVGAAAAHAPDDATQLPIHTIAVLPFENLSGSDEAEPFAVGLHDDLLTELSRIAALSVIARTSVLRYRDADRPIPQIARELGAGTIVEGGVRTEGGRLRLNVQVIDASTGAHRWAERYDRELSAQSIFDLQGQLAYDIAQALETELTSGEQRRTARGRTARGRTARRRTEDLEAYRVCVQGRALLDQRTPHSMHRSVDYFQRAIERDSRYALAWSGLADALSLLEFYDQGALASAPDPMEAALRAVELGPELGQARASLGIIRSIRHQGSAALAELEKAIDLTPSHAEAHAWLGWLRLLRGDPEGALVAEQRAVELDPLAPAFRTYLAEALLACDRPGEALREAVRAREIQPEYGLAHFMEGLVLFHLGRTVEAEVALETALGLVPPWGAPRHAEVHAVIAVIRARAGDPEGVGARLARIDTAAHPFSHALVLAALGEVDEAIAAMVGVRSWDSFAVDHYRYFFPQELGQLRADARYVRLREAIERTWC